VEIIDTPGTNDLDPRREEIANRFIPRSDAAILVLSAKQPLAKSEEGFLKERILASSIQKIFFAINFKDTLNNESDEITVLNHIKEHLKEFVPDPRLFLISAKGALKYRRKQADESLKISAPSLESTGYMEFESGLARFLANDRGSIKLLKPIERGLNLINELKNCIHRILPGLNINLEKYQIQSAQIRAELEKLKGVITDASNRLKTGLSLAGEDIKSELKSKLYEIAQAAVNAVNTYQGPLTKEDIARTIESKVAPLQTELSEWINRRQYEAIMIEYSQANQKFAFKWETIDNLMTASFCQQIINDKDLPLINNYDDEVAAPTFFSSAGVLILAGILTGGWTCLITPGVSFGLFTIFESKYRERQLGKIRGQVDARYHDVIPDMLKSWQKQWDEMVSSLIEGFNTEAQRKINTVETQLNSISRICNLEQSKVEKTKQQLNEQSAILELINSDLQNLRQELKKHCDSQ